MKKLFLLLITLFFISACELEEDKTIRFHIEYIALESVEMPEYFSPGENYKIKIRYRNPTDCHYFDGFYTESIGLVQTVAIQTVVIEHAECVDLNHKEPEEVVYDFTCPAQSVSSNGYGSYIFKFYKGEDAAGNETYLDVEVPVRE